MPKVSVIVPIYGVEEYLREALDSILNQSLTDLEILLIDDGSKDKCPQIIEEYAKKDNRIITIHKENGGYGSAMNVGLDNATGEYIGIVEPDDYIDLKMYENLYNIAKLFDSDIVKSCFYENMQSSTIKYCKKVNWNNDKIPNNRSFTIKDCGLFLSYHPSIWSCIYKREFLKKQNIRFIEAFGSGWTDNPFQVETMCLAERINYTPDAYYYWRRINIDESDDLKDYTIPFKRSDEIHQWLEEHKINDKETLACLYTRELAYIDTVLKMKKISNKQDCFERIKKMLKRMDKNIILNSSFFTKKQKKSYLSKLKNLHIQRFAILFKNFRKKLISVQWNRKNKKITLFGKTVIQKYCKDKYSEKE